MFYIIGSRRYEIMYFSLVSNQILEMHDFSGGSFYLIFKFALKVCSI